MRRVLAVCVAAIAPLAVIGCGGESPGRNTAVGDAGANTSTTLSSRVAFTIDLDEEGQVVGEGLFDYREQRGRVRVTSRGLEDDADRVDATDYEFIVPGTDVAYVRLPVLGLEDPEKRWLRYSVGRRRPLDEFGRDPVRLLHLLRSLSRDLERTGTETVRGERTDRYRGRLNLDDLLEQVPAEAKESWRATFRQYTEAQALPIELWIDRGEMLRRVRTVVTGRDGFTLTLELYDFGVEVAVQEPTADEVMTEAELDKLVENQLRKFQKGDADELGLGIDEAEAEAEVLLRFDDGKGGRTSARGKAPSK